MKFELSYTIPAHRADVRAVAASRSGNLITASRDCTAKLWESNKGGRGFEFNHTYEKHRNFVSAVCVVTNGDDNEFVVTGCNDKTIRVFDVLGSQPLLTIIAHSDTVCSVSPGLLSGTVVSASWDKSACLWNLFDNSREPVAVMKGHEATVWAAVQMPTGLMVTASADKNLMVWEPDGQLVETLHGHFDCVRDLVVHSATKVFSCSNDASVKLWDIERYSCLATFYGHDNYIYSITLLRGEEMLFITCGEDACVKIWNNDGCIQTINLPCHSAWCVTGLPNGDIAVGLSDGTVRVFTLTFERLAPGEEQEHFDNEVASRMARRAQKGANVKKDGLPGLEALSISGSHDGQTKLIRKDESVWCYKWSTAYQNWQKMGIVVEGDSGNGKQLYQGQEYDHVFNIDVEDGKPPLKLPYNLGQDPWAVAQKFIYDHDLSQGYLEQVAKFIIRNTEESDYATPVIASDPFTGDGRYVPPPAGQPAPKEITQEAGDTEHLSGTHAVGRFFPQRVCVAFNVYNKAVIEDKLLSNNALLKAQKLDVEDIDQAAMLLDGRLEEDNSQVETVIKMLYWPEDLLVPALDLIRVAVRSKPIYEKIFSVRDGREILEVIERCMLPVASTDVHRVLAIRTICNIMLHEEGSKLFLTQRDNIMYKIQKYKKPYTKHMQMALATLLLNLSVAANHERDVNTLSSVTLTTLDMLPQMREPEASFRALVALGTCVWDFDGLVWEEPLLLITTNAEIMDVITQMAAGGGGAPSSATDEQHKTLEKLHACAEELLHKLQMVTKD